MVNTYPGAHVVEVHWQFDIHEALIPVYWIYRVKVFDSGQIVEQVWVYRFTIGFMNFNFFAFIIEFSILHSKNLLFLLNT